MRHLIAVVPHRMHLAWPNPLAKPVYRQLPVVEALETVWRTDAHLVTYIVPTDDGMQHRLIKARAAEHELADSTYVNTLFFDVDNPGGHGEWTPALRADAEPKFARLRDAGFGYYLTKKGYRVVVLLDRDVHFSKAESYINAVFFQLARAGIEADPACRDVTRHFRLPRVVRDGRPYRGEIHMDHARPAFVPPVETPPMDRKARARRETPAEFKWQPISDPWERWVKPIADAMLRHEPSAAWHDVFLGMAGEMVERSVPFEIIPAWIAAISRATQADALTEDREKAARSTIERYSTGGSLMTLERYSWQLRDVVLEATAVGAEAEFYAQTREAEEAPLDESAALRVSADIEDAIRKAPVGVTLIVASCGIGKTKAAQRVAEERDEVEGHTTKDTRTSILVPTHKLSKQIYGELPRSERLFGPLSITEEDVFIGLDHPITIGACRLKHIAEPLVKGSQSLHWNFCLGRNKKPCDYLDTCLAARGKETRREEDDARIRVGTHARMGQIHASAGASELVVVDEPPPPLLQPRFTRADFRLLHTLGKTFDRHYVESMALAVDSLERLFDDPFAEVPRHDLSGVFSPEHRHGTSPPMVWSEMLSARYATPAHRARIGRVSELYAAVYDFYTAERSVASVDGEEVMLTYPNGAVVDLMKSGRRVVFLDANGLIDFPLYDALAPGYVHTPKTFIVGDGAPIERFHLRHMRATRSDWEGQLGSASLRTAVQAMVQWVKSHRCRRVGVVTFKFLADALRGPLRAMLSDLWDVTLRWGYYGNIRGTNEMADCDALVTLGDPFMNVATVEAVSAFLGGMSASDRLQALGRAELEQAHGRLRTVHRRVPGRALHVGRLIPTGVGWHQAKTERLQTGASSRHEKAVYQIEGLRHLVDFLGGVGSAAKITRLDRKQVWSCLEGRSTMSSQAYQRLLSARAKITGMC